MKKQTIPLDKKKTENKIRKTSEEISKLYNMLQTANINEITKEQLEDTKRNIMRIGTEIEAENLWYATIYGKTAPYYKHLMGIGKNTVKQINYRISRIDKLNSDPRNN